MKLCKGLMAAIGALVIVLSMSGVALAHADLEQATPAKDAVLNAAPTEVRLQFSEPVDFALGGVTVYDSGGRRVDQGDVAADSHDPAVLHVTLKPLQAGAYTVAWAAISDDGHPVSGTYGFRVGAAAGENYYQPGTPADADVPPISVMVSYWLSVGGLMALAGLGMTQAWVVKGEPGRPYRVTALLAASVSAVGTLLLLVTRTAQAAGASVGTVLANSLWRQLLATNAGQAMAWRLGFLAVALVLLPWLWRRWTVSAVLGGLGLFTVAVGGHALSLADPWTGVPLDWFHLLAAALWAGGLLQFGLVLVAGGTDGVATPAAPAAELWPMVRRFSPLAAGSILLLTLTGLYPLLIRVPSMRTLPGSAYGRAFLVKLMLILLLMILGGINLMIVGPRLRRGEPVSGLLRRVAALELVAIAAVLAAATVLTNTRPPRNPGLSSQPPAASQAVTPPLP